MPGCKTPATARRSPGRSCARLHSLSRPSRGMRMGTMRNLGFGLLASVTSVLAQPATAQPQKPNIVMIMADDIGFWNISAYNRGMMGYRTPNIDRIANEGAIFTDYYGQQSCTAGRAAYSFDFGVYNGVTFSGVIGYRALSVDYAQGSGRTRYEFDTVQHGPVLGISARF